MINIYINQFYVEHNYECNNIILHILFMKQLTSNLLVILIHITCNILFYITFI